MMDAKMLKQGQGPTSWQRELEGALSFTPGMDVEEPEGEGTQSPSATAGVAQADAHEEEPVDKKGEAAALREQISKDLEKEADRKEKELKEKAASRQCG